MTKKESRLAWLDLEMTGLHPETDTIMEIATIVTDKDLHVLAEGPVYAIHHTNAALKAMDPWCVEQHGKSGLSDRCRKSKVTLAQAEKGTLEFLKKHIPAKKIPLCGNTIGQDRRFLVKYMPALNDYLHYRSVDVSTVKELVKRWYPESKHVSGKVKMHEALEDIRESIRELMHYRKTVFK
jgi:oligoribonuclease